MKEIISNAFSVKELALHLSVHRNTIMNGIKCGRIKAFKVGRGRTASWRIMRYEVERMAALDATEIIEKIINDRSK